MPSWHRITLEELHDRRWELLALTSVGAFMTPLDGSIVSVALGKMGFDLKLSFGASIWVQAAYLLATAVLLIPVGRLADHHGRVRFYLAGVVIFTLGSLLSGFSMNGTWLISSRVLQGAGGALLAATSAAIVTAVFPPKERGKALGINVMAVYIGLAVGPVLGGQIVDNFGWRWIFFVNIPIGIVTFIWGSFLLPRSERPNEAAPRNDLVGAILLGAFLIALLVPLTFAQEWGWAAASTIVLLVVSVASLVGFAYTELHVKDPLLDLDLVLHNRLFATANAAALLNYMALYAISILTAIYLEIVQGRSAGVTGWLMVAQPAMMAILSPVAGRLSDRFGSRVLSTAGMALVAAGMVMLATVPITAGVARVMVSLAVVGIGMAAFSAPNTSAIMGSVERSKLSLASAFLGTMRVTGQAMSVAVLGAIAASKLGVSGSRLIYTNGQAVGPTAHGAATTTAEAAAHQAALHIIQNYALGYKYAMFTGAGLALTGALASLTRPTQVPQVPGGPPPAPAGAPGPSPAGAPPSAAAAAAPTQH
ncbi:MAG: MFS transporter [Thermoleophilia bacterium]